MYAQRSGMAYFVPITIDGYPAVLADLNDFRGEGTCALNLGVADTSVLALDYQQQDLHPGALACDTVQTLARDVIDTLHTP